MIGILGRVALGLVCCAALSGCGDDDDPSGGGESDEVPTYLDPSASPDEVVAALESNFCSNARIGENPIGYTTVDCAATNAADGAIFFSVFDSSTELDLFIENQSCTSSGIYYVAGPTWLAHSAHLSAAASLVDAGAERLNCG